MDSTDHDVSTANFAEFAAKNPVDFHDGDALKMNIWVGNHSEMERLAEISWTGADAEAIVNYDTDEVTDEDRDTFLLEAVIEGLQRELDRRMRNNFESLPQHVKEALDRSVDAHPGARPERPVKSAGAHGIRRSTTADATGICCPGVAMGGGHDHGTMVVEL